MAALKRLGTGLSKKTLEVHLCPRIAMTAEPPACASIRFWAVALPATRDDPKARPFLNVLIWGECRGPFHAQDR